MITTCKQTNKQLKLDLNPTLLTKHNPKCMTNLNVKYTIIQLVKVNTGEDICDLELIKEFLSTALKHDPWTPSPFRESSTI